MTARPLVVIGERAALFPFSTGAVFPCGEIGWNQVPMLMTAGALEPSMVRAPALLFSHPKDLQMRNGETPLDGFMSDMDARREFKITERDLRRAIGYHLVRNPIVPGYGRMVVRDELERFLATYDRRRPPRPVLAEKQCQLAVRTAIRPTSPILGARHR